MAGALNQALAAALVADERCQREAHLPGERIDRVIDELIVPAPAFETTRVAILHPAHLPARQVDNLLQARTAGAVLRGQFGGLNQGAKVLMSGLDYERAVLTGGLVMLGVAQGLADHGEPARQPRRELRGLLRRDEPPGGVEQPHLAQAGPRVHQAGAAQALRLDVADHLQAQVPGGHGDHLDGAGGGRVDRRRAGCRHGRQPCAFEKSAAVELILVHQSLLGVGPMPYCMARRAPATHTP